MVQTVLLRTSPTYWTFSSVGDIVQTFNTKWDETIFAMQQQPDEELMENFFFRPLENLIS